jgi:putative endopeptidase
MIKTTCVAFLLLFCLTTIAQSGRHFIDKANMDVSVKPGRIFYLYANGNWIKNNPVPPSKTRWSNFGVLAEEASNSLKSLLEEAAANPGKDRIMQMTGDFYASAMDSATIEKAGYNPIKAELERLAAITTLEQVTDEIAGMRTRGIASPLFGFTVLQDSKRVNEYIPQLGQGGTTLPDRDYYLKDDARSTKIRSEYLDFIADMFKLVKVDEAVAKQNADKILALETVFGQCPVEQGGTAGPTKAV